jgi:hypothetical protein
MVQDVMSQIPAVAKAGIDGIAIATAVLTWLNLLLPAVASILSIIWLGIRVYDYVRFGRGSLNKDD